MVVGREEETKVVRKQVCSKASLVGEERRWVDEGGEVVVVEVDFGQELHAPRAR